jgi:hypothetical protein
MYHTYIVSDTWLVSATAKKVYIAAALLTVLFFGLLIAILAATVFAGGSLAQSPWLSSVLKALLFICILGTALLDVSMWYFWYRFHPSDGMSKALWAGLFIISGPIGALLYFVAVYLRSPEVGSVAKAQAASA